MQNYLPHIGRGDKAYTKEGFERIKYFMGVFVLRASLDDQTPQKRWQIETFYNYFKNNAGYNSLHEQDYYKTQGLAFVMLVSALIHQEVEAAAASIYGKSIPDCLLEARMVKATNVMEKGLFAICSSGRPSFFHS